MNDHFDPKDFKLEGLNEYDIIQLHEVFNEFNTTKNGYISPNELKTAFKKYLGLTISKKSMYKILSRFDNDMNGDLSFEDFLKIASKEREDELAKYEIKALFKSKFI